MVTTKIRPEKLALAQEYRGRVLSSPYLILINYQGLNVAEFTQLRRKLADHGAEIHVIKNRVFKKAIADLDFTDFPNKLTGQLAVITGRQDIAAAAKVLKEFNKQTNKGVIQFGFLGKRFLTKELIDQIAELPPLDNLRAQLIGAIKAPMARLVMIINEPAARIARIIRSHSEKQTN